MTVQATHICMAPGTAQPTDVSMALDYSTDHGTHMAFSGNVGHRHQRSVDADMEFHF